MKTNHYSADTTNIYFLDRLFRPSTTCWDGRKIEYRVEEVQGDRKT